MSSNLRTLSSLAIAVLTALLLLACGQSSEADLAGVYELDVEKTKAEFERVIDTSDSPEEQMAMQMVLGMFGAMSMTVTLEEDGVARMTMSMMGESNEEVGTWSLSGNDITITDASGESVNGTLRNDVLELRMEDDDMPALPMTFNRTDR